MHKLVKWLAIANEIEVFRSSWGAMCRPQYNDTLSKWLIPLGWESELESRGIEFEVVEFNLLSEEEDLSFKIISEDGVITDQEKQENPSLWDKIKSWWNS
jgi:hypothetical protein